MKKLITGVAAGALLLSAVGVAFASSHHGGNSVVQFSDTTSVTGASSISGQNGQSGNGRQHMFTGSSDSSAVSLTGGNVNIGEGSGSVFQGASTGSVTGASSISGQNGQTGGSSHHHHGSSSQLMGTGDSSSYAGSATISNVNVSL